MRLTCLKCGNQIELASVPAGVRVNCTCGLEHTYPEVHNTGIKPNERAAERSRSRAFRAAGLVKNVGGFALGLSTLSILFFPFGLLGACVGLYVLTMLRGPVSRYSGRRAAMAAVALGSVVFGVGAVFTYSWVEARRTERVTALQQGASEDLRALLRAERLFRVGSDTYGTFKELHFTPRQGNYTLYLAPDDVLAGRRDGDTVVDALPADVQPGVSEDAFTAVAIANIDSDADLDVWVLNDTGTIEHVHDDLANQRQ